MTKYIIAVILSLALITGMGFTAMAQENETQQSVFSYFSPTVGVAYSTFGTTLFNVGLDFGVLELGGVGNFSLAPNNPTDVIGPYVKLDLATPAGLALYGKYQGLYAFNYGPDEWVRAYVLNLGTSVVFTDWFNGFVEAGFAGFVPTGDPLYWAPVISVGAQFYIP